MVIINDLSVDKFKKLNKDNFYVVADFDRTISTHMSNPTFSLFAKSGIYPSEYVKERDKLYEHYRPLEIDPNITDEEKCAIMNEWWHNSYGLMLKYKVKESDVKKIIERVELVNLREGAIEFIRLLNNLGIPLIINSAGIGNFITELLKKYGILSDNIYIFSNILEFKDDIVIDSIKDMVHSMNKYNIELPTSYQRKIDDRPYPIIIGDQISDLCMADNLPKENTISFGFLEANVETMEDTFKDQFDVVLKSNESFAPIGKLLKLK